MTALDLNRTQQLAQESYDFVQNRLPDQTAPIYALLNRLGIDHSDFMQLEFAINNAIAEAEHNSFVVGFTLSHAIANVPLFSSDPMDAVLMPDRYVAA